MSEAARILLAAGHDQRWSFVVAAGIVLLVAGVRELPEGWKVTAWTRTGLGGVLFAVLASLGGGFAAAFAAEQNPWSLEIVMSALSVAAKAIALYQAQKRVRGVAPQTGVPRSSDPALPVAAKKDDTP